MKPKHIQMRIEQCVALARLSPCPRRKYGAVAVDPVNNVILSEGYNGTPRGSAGELCGGAFCRRDGIPTHEVQEVRGKHYIRPVGTGIVNVLGSALPVEYASPFDVHGPFDRAGAEDAERFLRHDPVPSGTRYEIGCHHSEANVVTNAARMGRQLMGAWLFVTGMPCLGCARLVHHAGIAKVVTIRGGYAKGDEGAAYLLAHGVEIEEVEPPDAGAAGVGAFVDPGGR